MIVVWGSDNQKLNAIKQVNDIVMEKDDEAHSQKDVILGVKLADINFSIDIKGKGNKLKLVYITCFLLVV